MNDFRLDAKSESRSVRRYAETLEIRPSLRSRIMGHRSFPVILLLVLVITLVCVQIWQRAYAIELANEVALLRQSQQSSTDHLKKLSSEIVALSTPTRIQNYASDSLGMKPVAAERLFTLVTEKAESTKAETPLSEMYAAFVRLGDYLPTSTEALAEPRDIAGVRFDTARVESNRQVVKR